MPLERLQKVLASAGLGSRRSCEDLIVQGRVTVNGQCVTELGTKVDTGRQEIRCDGELVRPARKVYFLVNKPRGHVCAEHDPGGRPCVFALLKVRGQRLFTVGRLEAETEGLVVVTNDGDFAQRVAHPYHGVTKTYQAHVHGSVTNAIKREMLTGVWIEGRRCRAAWVKIDRKGSNESLLEVTMQEDRPRELRRMLAKVGHPASYVRRIRIGPIGDAGLEAGRSRNLTPAEVAELLAAAGTTGVRPASRHKARSTISRKDEA